MNILSRKRIVQELIKAGAIIPDDHFVLKSRRHATTFVAKDAIQPQLPLVKQLSSQMARYYKQHGVQTVIGPAIGGIILAQWVAHALKRSSGRDVSPIYAEKVRGDDGKDHLVINRPSFLPYLKDKRVLVVEDVLTTGSSAREVVELVRANGGLVVGVAGLVNRGNGQQLVDTAALGHVPQFSWLVDYKDLVAVLGERRFQTWATEEEFRAANGEIPIRLDYGHGKDYLAEKTAQARWHTTELV